MSADSWTCWRCDAMNDATAAVCEACGATKRQSPTTAPGASPFDKCDQCGNVTKGTNLFMAESGAARRLCSGCRVTALRGRHVSRHQRCTEPGCSLTVGDHIDEAKRIASGYAWQLRFGTRRAG